MSTKCTWPVSDNFGPEPVQFGRLQTRLGRLRPDFGLGSTSVGPASMNFGQLRPDLAQTCPDLIDSGPDLAGFGQTGSGFGQFWPTFAKSSQLPESGATFVDVDQGWHGFGQVRSKSRQLWLSQRASHGNHWADVGGASGHVWRTRARMSPKSGQILPKSATIGRSRATSLATPLPQRSNCGSGANSTTRRPNRSTCPSGFHQFFATPVCYVAVARPGGLGGPKSCGACAWPVLYVTVQHSTKSRLLDAHPERSSTLA